MGIPFRSIAGVVATVVCFGCSSSQKSGRPDAGAARLDAGADASVAPASQDALTAAGPYGVATIEQTFVDSSRGTPANGTQPAAADRTLVTKIWFPSSDGTTVASGGPFPVIAYAHGFLGTRNAEEPLKSHLASHGYIVIAPQFPLSSFGAPGGPTFRDLANQPGDLAFVVEQVGALTGAHADLAAAVDMTRQGVAGLSLGGATVLISVYHPVLHLPKVQAAFAMAPLSCAFGKNMYEHSVPTLILNGGSDELVPFDTVATHPQAWAPPPLEVAKLIGGTHVGFTGIDVPDAGNSDQVVGCGPVESALGGPTIDPSTLAPLITEINAGVDGGVADTTGCGPVCGTHYTQSMRATRQIELAKAAALAHFEAILRGKKDAAAYLATAFDAQNDDVEVTRAK